MGVPDNARETARILGENLPVVLLAVAVLCGAAGPMLAAAALAAVFASRALRAWVVRRSRG